MKHQGALAQLGARLNGIQKVVGSSPICSRNKTASHLRGCFDKVKCELTILVGLWAIVLLTI